MAKEKISITVDRQLLTRVDELCDRTGEKRSAVLERLCSRGLEAESMPGDGMSYFKLVAPMSAIKAVVADLKIVDDSKPMEMLLWPDESQRRKWTFAARGVIAAIEERPGGEAALDIHVGGEPGGEA